MFISLVAMQNDVDPKWLAANKQYLMTAVDIVRLKLDRYLAVLHDRKWNEEELCAAEDKLKEAEMALSGPAALHVLCDTFSLSGFEKDVLLLCFGAEVDAAIRAQCAAVNGDEDAAYPTQGVVLAAFSSAEWHSVSPTAPLRFWQLVEEEKDDWMSPLRKLTIDEHIMHYLLGVQHMDARLASYITPVSITGEELLPSREAVAQKVASIWSGNPDGTMPGLIQLYGREASSKQAVAAHAANMLGFKLWRLPTHKLPADTGALTMLLRLWAREAVLNKYALLLDCTHETVSEAVRNVVMERVGGFTVVSLAERGSFFMSVAASLEITHPTTEEQRVLWEKVLGDNAPNMAGFINKIVYQFNMHEAAIKAVSLIISRTLAEKEEGTAMPEGLEQLLWEQCKVQGRSQLDAYAQRIETTSLWKDLVLPAKQLDALKEIEAQIIHRSTVHGRWGFTEKMGIVALFSGPSGTGKTLAAEVLANSLNLDLYRVDLSRIVNKYIGETEKNLRQVFEAAEMGAAILFFDEADALFGKRVDVRESHDLYANLEVSYLLQRLQSYRGLAILSVSTHEALDTAFLRRLRFTVSFPFPDTSAREQLWSQAFPAEVPTADLDFARLAQYELTGGAIRSIAMNTAFLVAHKDGPVAMEHVLQAIKQAYVRLHE